MHGFTLIEMALSIAIIALLAVLSVPVYQSFQVRDDLDITAQTLVQNLRRAAAQSRNGVGDGDWGVSIQTSTIVLFSGSSYSVRSSTLDEIFSFPTSLAATGTAEYIFTRFTGNPVLVGTTTLNSSINEIRVVSVNEYGVVSY